MTDEDLESLLPKDCMAHADSAIDLPADVLYSPEKERELAAVYGRQSLRLLPVYLLLIVLFSYGIHIDYWAGYKEEYADLWKTEEGSTVILPTFIVGTSWSVMPKERIDLYGSPGTDSLLGDPSFARFINQTKCMINGFYSPYGDSLSCADGVLINDTERNSFGGWKFGGQEIKIPSQERWHFVRPREFVLLQAFYYFDSNVSKSWYGTGQSSGPTALFGAYNDEKIPATLSDTLVDLTRISANSLNYVALDKVVTSSRRFFVRKLKTTDWRFSISLTPDNEVKQCDLAYGTSNLRPCCLSIEVRLGSRQYTKRTKYSSWMFAFVNFMAALTLTRSLMQMMPVSLRIAYDDIQFVRGLYELIGSLPQATISLLKRLLDRNTRPQVK